MRTCAGLPLALAFVALVGAQSPAARLARRADPTTCYTSVASSTAGAPATTSTSSPGCAASFVCGATTTSTVSSAGADNTETTTVEEFATCDAVGGGPQRRARALLRRGQTPLSPSECPSGLTSCQMDGMSDGATECVDTQYELGHCGSCGNDCTLIAGAFGVGCDAGRCVVLSCEQGYEPTADRKSCMPATVPTGLARHRQRRSAYMNF